MSLMGIDVGTTGCKVSIFSETGKCIEYSYKEYSVISELPGWKELDSSALWENIRMCIKETVLKSRYDPVKALSVSSFGEAMTPVSRDRKILGNCILATDIRGTEYVDIIERIIGKGRLYDINGNNADFAYSLPKLLWLKDNRPDLFNSTYKFLLWQDLIFFLLGCEPVTDYSLASRTLIYDLKREKWSDEILNAAGIPEEKLPLLAPAGTHIGYVCDSMASELGLPAKVAVIVGGHDQCCNSLGAGIVRKGSAAFGIGTYVCTTPVFEDLSGIKLLHENKFCIESFVVPDLFVTLLYNATGGSLFKWFRDIFCQIEKKVLHEKGIDIYDHLTSEVPDNPSGVLVLPGFLSTEVQTIRKYSSGMISGLSLDTTRGEFIKGLLEGVIYYINDKIALLEKSGVFIDEYRPTGGGSKSDIWVQIACDIIGKPFTRPQIIEAGSLGAAILAGTGIGAFKSSVEAAKSLVGIEKEFEPNFEKHRIYREKMDNYRDLLSRLQ